MIFMGSQGINWLSEDCGATLVGMNQGRNVNEFQFHPSERKWLLAAAWTLCDDFDSNPCKIYKEVFVSTDLAVNWDLMEDYVVQFAWASTEKSNNTLIPKERIFLAHEPSGKGHQKISGWSEKVHLSFSDNFFKTRKMLVMYGNKFLVTDNFIFVAKVISEETQDVSLMVANPNDPNYKFSEATLPMRRLKDHSYTILDSSEKQVFLHVNHFGPNSKYGNIYISDETGSKYTFSLSNNVRNMDGQCDFEKVEAIDGVFISNVYTDEAVQLIRDQEKPTSKSERRGKRQKEMAKSHLEDLDNFKKSLISFDKGGIWQPLTPPSVDSTGAKYPCNGVDCALHLHAMTNTKFGPFYSTENSAGVIIGTGNVGKHLSNKADEVNTFLSRDAGMTWNEIKKGSHIYEIGDHGGILIMTSDQKATNEVLYSWDEGKTWNTYQFSPRVVNVNNIIIEPTNTATSFVLYGENDFGKGILISLDFASLHDNTCKGADNPNGYDSDYETWSPTDSSSNCILGRKLTFTRKKQDSKCFNGEKFERKRIMESCECTESDWECDSGFIREGKGPCVDITTKKKRELDFNPPKICNGYFSVTQGYRKVAGSLCERGIDYSPIKVPCNPSFFQNLFSGFSFSFGGKFTSWLFLLAVLAVMYIGFTNKEQVLDLTLSTGEKITEFVSTFFKGKSSSFERLPGQDTDFNFNKVIFDDDDEEEEN